MHALSTRQHCIRGRTCHLQARRWHITAAAAAKKGFGGPENKQAQQVAEPAAAPEAVPGDDEQPSTSAAAPAGASAADREEALEALLRKKKSKKGRVEPKVKVESAVVDMATGKTPANPAGEAETKVIQVLLGFFGILLTEGLVLSGSGFLPADLDAFVQDVIYPSYSPQMLLFLGMSSAYGLWKTGKLPGQQQMK